MPKDDDEPDLMAYAPDGWPVAALSTAPVADADAGLTKTDLIEAQADADDLHRYFHPGARLGVSREAIARTLADKLWCGATFDDGTNSEREAFLNAADAILALAAEGPKE